MQNSEQALSPKEQQLQMQQIEQARAEFRRLLKTMSKNDLVKTVISLYMELERLNIMIQQAMNEASEKQQTVEKEKE